MNKTSRFLLVLTILCVTFVLGFKLGGYRGFQQGYDVGYRYDCKEEIGDLYKQVKNQSRALKYTDSVIKKVSHLNDSLIRKEYFQKRFQDSVKWRENYSSDSLRLSTVSRKFADSLNKAIGGHVVNIVGDDGKINLFACSLEPYKKIRECQFGYDLRAELEKRANRKSSKKRGKK